MDSVIRSTTSNRDTMMHEAIRMFYGRDKVPLELIDQLKAHPLRDRGTALQWFETCVFAVHSFMAVGAINAVCKGRTEGILRSYFYTKDKKSSDLLLAVKAHGDNITVQLPIDDDGYIQIEFSCRRRFLRSPKMTVVRAWLVKGRNVLSEFCDSGSAPVGDESAIETEVELTALK